MPLYVKSTISKKYFPDDLYKKYGVCTLFPKEDFLPFKKAKEFALKLKLKNLKEWKKYCTSGKKPENIPSSPDQVYHNKGWTSWGDFLGTGYVHKKIFLPFEKARTFVRKLKFKNTRCFTEYCKSGKKPENIPSQPHKNYKNKGWISWGDWLGNGQKKREKYCDNLLPFNKVKKIVRNLGIKSFKQWLELCSAGKKPDRIPTNVNVVYKGYGWKNWADFLGTSRVHKKYSISFKDAKKKILDLGIKSSREWFNLCKSGKHPDDIPINIDTCYKNKGWISWKNFLEKEFISYDEAKTFCRKKNIKTCAEWRKYCKNGKRPESVPSNPNQVYKDKGWISWGDFLGTGNICKKIFMSYNEAKTFCRKNRIKTSTEWIEYCKNNKRPDNVPSNPQKIYKDKGWISWPDFLGTK